MTTIHVLSWPRRILPAGLAALLLTMPHAQAPPPVVSVKAVPVERVSPGADFLGRMEAINAVDIRSRIEGFVEARPFSERQLLQEGQELFLIERAAYETALATASASLAGAQADLRDAEGRFQRNQELRRTQVASQGGVGGSPGGP
jgi:membrane fusion protein (multidrug efflux system)